jgi:hypothetical protein
LVSTDGLIAFHDIAVCPTPERGLEVSRLWEEIAPLYPSRAIIEDVKQEWAGIGILTPRLLDGS